MTKQQKHKKELKDIKEEVIEKQGGETEELEKKAKEYLDGWKRCQADFENYKKNQTESGKEMARYATQNIALQIIPVLDNFQSAAGHIPEDQKGGAWVQGIMYIQKQLEDVLRENEIEEVEAKPGDDFDPNIHEAIEENKNQDECNCEHCECEEEKKTDECSCGHCECEEEKKEKKEGFKNKIKQVILKGYKIGNKVIRPARVVVE